MSLRRLLSWWQIGLVALISFVPPLRSAPGRMPSDTKLYLYLDPGRLLSDAPWMWDARQFGGWVPHQAVGYLWPMGPWFWTADRVGLPDWVAHRLWIGMLVFVATTGVRWAGRRLGLSSGAATAAGLLYGLSPYILPYVARTSGQLPSWACVGWVAGLTISGVARLHPSQPRMGRLERWREPVAIGLVVATASGLNATAIILIAPVAAIWLIDAALRREVGVLRLAGFVWRTGAACLALCAWWIAGLAVQGGYGADVLGFTETLRAVSFTSSGGEVLRGMGYWLSYVTDRTGALTDAAVRYQVSLPSIAVSFIPIGLAVIAIAAVRWRARRYAAWLIAAGLVLGVGVHPIDQAAPLFSSLAAAPGSGLALALRSSTRAVPCLLLGMTLAVGALTDAWRSWIDRRPERRAATTLRAAAPVAVGLLAAVNLPAWWTGGLVSPSQSRDQDVPQPWIDAAASLNRSSGRVLQIPGAEFGVHRWGTLVDPLLPALIDRPFITRDLVPGGNPATMDLLYAFDDRLQDGLLAPAAVAPIARMLGATDIVVPGDLAIERYRTRRPGLVDALLGRAAGVGDAVTFGTPIDRQPPGLYDDGQLDSSDRSVGAGAPVTIRSVEGAAPSIDATTTAPTLIVGSGAGVVDAAEAGLIDGRGVVRYAAALDDDVLQAASDSAGLVIVTDSNRLEAHHWRGSRDVIGATEAAVTRGDGAHAEAPDPIDEADHRLTVFPNGRISDMTTGSWGDVAVTQSAYGDPVTYRPEDRGAMAIDGDPATAWRVGDRAEVIGETLSLRWAQSSAPSSVRVLQPDVSQRGDARWITQIRLTTDSGSLLADLDDSSRHGDGQVVDLPSGSTTGLTVEITATDIGRRDAYPGVGPVGIAELAIEGVTPVVETISLPTRLPGDTDGKLAVVLTRRRADPDDRWRSDPEPAMQRRLVLPDDGGSLGLTTEVRLDPHLSDAELGGVIGVALPTASSRLGGSPQHAAWAAIDADEATAWVTGGLDPTGSSITIPWEGSADRVTVAFVDDGLHSQPTRFEWRLGATTRGLDVAIQGESDMRRVELDTAGMTGSELTITLAAVDPVMATDSRTLEQIVRPVAISTVASPAIRQVTLPDQIAIDCTPLVRLDGTAIALEGRAALSDLLAGLPLKATPCDGEPVELAAGDHSVSGITVPGWQLDRVVLQSTGLTAPTSTSLPVVQDRPTRTGRSATIDRCASGCWVVLAEGANAGWKATVDGSEIGPAETVSAGWSGWYLPPGDALRKFRADWQPQRTMWRGIAVTLVALVGAAGVLLGSARRRDLRTAPSMVAPSLVAPWRARTGRKRFAGTLVAFAAGLVVIGPLWGLAAAALVLVAGWLRRPRLVAMASAVIVESIALWYLVTIRADRPGPGYGWVINIEATHRWAVFAVVLLAAAVSRDRADSEPIARDLAHPSG